MQTLTTKCSYQGDRLNGQQFSNGVPKYHGGVVQVRMTFSVKEDTATINALYTQVRNRLLDYQIPVHDMSRVPSVGLQPGVLRIDYVMNSHMEEKKSSRVFGWLPKRLIQFGRKPVEPPSPEETLRKELNLVLRSFLKTYPQQSYACVEVTLHDDFNELHGVAADILNNELAFAGKQCDYLSLESSTDKFAIPVRLAVTNRTKTQPPVVGSLYHLELKATKFIDYTPPGSARVLNTDHVEVGVSMPWKRPELVTLTGLDQSSLDSFSQQTPFMNVEIDQKAQTFELRPAGGCELRWFNPSEKQWSSLTVLKGGQSRFFATAQPTEDGSTTDVTAIANLRQVQLRIKNKAARGIEFVLNQIHPIVIDDDFDQASEAESFSSTASSTNPVPPPQSELVVDEILKVVPATSADTPSRTETRPDVISSRMALVFRFRRAVREVNGLLVPVAMLDHLPAHPVRGVLSISLSRVTLKALTGLPDSMLSAFSDTPKDTPLLTVSEDGTRLTVSGGGLVAELVDGKDVVPLSKERTLALPCALRLGDGIPMEPLHTEVVALDVEIIVAHSMGKLIVSERIATRKELRVAAVPDDAQLVDERTVQAIEIVPQVMVVDNPTVAQSVAVEADTEPHLQLAAPIADAEPDSPPLPALPALSGPALPLEFKEWRDASDARIEYCWSARRGRTHLHYEDRVSVFPIKDGGWRLIVLDGVSYKEHAPNAYDFVETALRALESSAARASSPVESLIEADTVIDQYNLRHACWTGVAAVVVDIHCRKGRHYMTGAAMGDCVLAIWSRPWWSTHRRLHRLTAPSIAGPIRDCLGMGLRQREGGPSPVPIVTRRLRPGDLILLASDGAFPPDLALPAAEALCQRLNTGFGLDTVCDAFIREGRLSGSDQDDSTLLLCRLGL